jgi:hypothetical protein
LNEVTRILSAIDRGDPQAAEQLLPLVYEELRKPAAQKPAREKPGQTLEATALVHEKSNGGFVAPSLSWSFSLTFRLRCERGCRSTRTRLNILCKLR